MFLTNRRDEFPGHRKPHGGHARSRSKGGNIFPGPCDRRDQHAAPQMHGKFYECARCRFPVEHQRRKCVPDPNRSQYARRQLSRMFPRRLLTRLFLVSTMTRRQVPERVDSDCYGVDKSSSLGQMRNFLIIPHTCGFHRCPEGKSEYGRYHYHG